MEKFSRTLRGYNPEEVNEFLDNVIKQVEQIVSESKNKDIKIAELEKSLEQSKHKLETYERMEATLNKAILMAQKTSEQIKLNAHDESELITIFTGEDVNEEETEAIEEYVSETYPDVEVEMIDGGQPVYSFIVSVE